MKSLRLATFALWAGCVFAASGCRTAGFRDLTRGDNPAPPRVTETAAELLADHNRNAEKVGSLEAKPSVTVNHRNITGALSGKLAFERDRNFKLVLSSPMNEVADIGSNEGEFWFWVKDNQQPGIYYCNYDDSGASPLASSMQPDWVIESLGLRVVSDDEAAQIRVNPGPDPGTVVLTYKERQTQGRSFVKETILSESTHRIREYRVSSPDRKTLYARATISDYQEMNLPAEAGQPAEKIVLPKRMRLEWVQEKLVLDVALREVKINPKWSKDRKAALFVEPEIPGVARKNLAELAGLADNPARPAASNDRTSIRQSMPAPPPRVRLSEPSPLGRRAGPADASPIAVNLPAANARGVEAVVGPPIPHVSDPATAYAQANSGWRSDLGSALER
jgi:hypothetical protein